ESPNQTRAPLEYEPRPRPRSTTRKKDANGQDTARLKSSTATPPNRPRRCQPAHKNRPGATKSTIARPRALWNWVAPPLHHLRLLRRLHLQVHFSIALAVIASCGG